MSTVSQQKTVFVVPGDLLGTSDTVLAGRGCYECGGTIRSSICGILSISEKHEYGSAKITVSVISSKAEDAEDCVINIGDVVLCRVQKISTHQATVEIVRVGDSVIRDDPPKGVIRKEDIRSDEVDTIVIHECFRHGDFVRAEVVSLGDSRQYYLSTVAVEHGVLRAKSDSGHIMTPVSWKVIHLF